MTDFFLDSNVCVYAFDKRNVTKQDKALELVYVQPYVSSQIVIETHNPCRKKLELEESLCDENILYLLDLCSFVEIKEDTLRKAFLLKRKYKYSLLDSIILSSALVANCGILYSEDMQHKQVIEDKLTIVNPFV